MNQAQSGEIIRSNSGANGMLPGGTCVKYWLTLLLLVVVWATTYGAKLEIYPPPKPPPTPPSTSY